MQDFPNFSDERIAADEADRQRQRQDAERQRQDAADLARLIRDGNAVGGAGGGAGAVGGAGGAAGGGDAGNQEIQMMEMMRLISQMTLSNQQAQQVMLQRQDASTAAAADLAAINAATAATALAKQTPEMSLNTPVLFWGITRASNNGNGKGITPNSFLKELESRQTRHNWTDSELLRYVQSCLRGEADLWWTGMLTTYDNLGPAGPTTNYTAFKLAFRQHYGIGGMTHKLNWADSFHQRSSKSTAEYFARSSAELANHLRESGTLLFGKEYACADITAPFTNLHTAIETEIRNDTVTVESFTRQLRAALTASTAAMKAHDMNRLKSYRTNLHTFLNSQAIFQGIRSATSRTFATEQLDKQGDEIYSKRGTMLLITDKIIEQERVLGLSLNAPLNSAAASTSSALPPPPLATDPTVEALQKQQQKRKGKGKGKGKGTSNAISTDNAENGNVNASDVAVVPPIRRPSNGKECQFCERSGHVEAECFSKKACLKHGHKVASASATASFPAPYSNGPGVPPPRSQRDPNYNW
jgi:hypothetical protein